MSLTGKKILIIDDDVFIRDIVEQGFKAKNAAIITASNGHEGLRVFYQQQPDLVLLDVLMPYLDGWEVCQQIRRLSDVPIIMITSLKSEAEILRGLEYGAVDYITKPFNLKILTAKAEAILRYAGNLEQVQTLSTYADDYIKIDIDKHQLIVNGEPVKITKTEFKLLTFLVKHAGIVLTFNQILENVWGWEYQDSIEYVHVYVSRLRQKLEPDPKEPRYLLTEYGVGYRFEKSPI
jgi:two-component system, OmpR family, KDP operon response regulator KdpE